MEIMERGMVGQMAGVELVHGTRPHSRRGANQSSRYTSSSSIGETANGSMSIAFLTRSPTKARTNC